MQSFNKPGVYTAINDIKIKHVLMCNMKPTLVDAIIPKDSTVVHVRKYVHPSTVSMDNNGRVSVDFNRRIKNEIKNDELRTDHIKFLNIDKCRLTKLNRYFTSIRDVESNTVYKTELDRNIEITYGKGFHVSQDPKQAEHLVYMLS